MEVTEEIKTQARYELNRAVKAGKVVRPDICSSCNRSDCRVGGHHEDYSKPLEVDWLCNRCHKIEHHRMDGTANPKMYSSVFVDGKTYHMPTLKESPAVSCGHLTDSLTDEHKYFEDNEPIDWDKYLNQLTYREREIIKLRFGFADGHTYTLLEIAHIFKVTRERVRQIEAKAIRRLRMRVVA